MADTDLRDKDGEGLTQEMGRIQRQFGHPSGEAPMSIGERSRAAWRIVRPYWNKTAWWTMLVISVIMVGLDLNARFGGFIGDGIEWVRLNVMAEYPSFAFITGMVACYYLVLRGRNRANFSDGETD